MKEAAAAIIDATSIESAAHPRTHVKAPAEDRAEDETPDEPAPVVFSADHDAWWIKKGRKSMLGYKGFVRCDAAFPSMELAFHAFQAMPNGSDFEKRDQALFAFFLLTGARDGAVASLKLKHINLFDGCVYMNARDVNTKNSKTFQTYFFPVGAVYLECFTAWIVYLRKDKLCGDADALFPKAERRLVEGCIVIDRLSRYNYANASAIREIIRKAFTAVQLPAYTPHLFRKTLAILSNVLCDTMEQMKA